MTHLGTPRRRSGRRRLALGAALAATALAAASGHDNDPTRVVLAAQEPTGIPSEPSPFGESAPEPPRDDLPPLTLDGDEPPASDAAEAAEPSPRMSHLPPEAEALLPRIEQIRPEPLPAIADDPPPHEGALIDVPYTIQPPDKLAIEVPEALPGRPITGARTVQPDGTIRLGFYGSVHVRGLTLTQAKTKIILHLRRFLNDSELGLLVYSPPAESAGEEQLHPPVPDEENLNPFVDGAFPPLPDAPREDNPFLIDAAPPPPDLPAPEEDRPPEPEAHHTAPRSAFRATRAQVGHRDGPAVAPPLPSPDFPTPAAGGGPAGAFEATSRTPDGGTLRFVAPALSGRVLVDVAETPSLSYHVEGDVAKPGEQPITGADTVLDALSRAGGLSATADPSQITLVRPGRGSSAPRVFAIDRDAILRAGEARANLQLFPGDRLVVGRLAIARQAEAIERAAAPVNAVLNALLTESYLRRSLEGTPPTPAGLTLSLGGLRLAITAGTPRSGPTPAERAALHRRWADFWSAALSDPGAGPIDEQQIRELLRHVVTPARE